MKISVIIPTYNRRNCILDAVNSVLNQNSNSNDFEVIVVDDGSKDDTPSLFSVGIDQRYVKYYRYEDNHGVNYARNYGITHSTGDYLIFLDSDDILTGNAFEILRKHERELDYMNFFKTAELITGKNMCKTEAGIYNYKEWLSGVNVGEMLPVVQKEVFSKFRYEEDMFCFEGYLWNQVIREYGSFKIFDEVIRLYSYAESNRVSPQLLKLSKAKQRYKDYKKYLAEFKKDYISNRLYTQYFSILIRKWVYFCLGVLATILNRV